MMRVPKKEKEINSLLHNATRRMLFIFFILGMFPMSGLLSSNAGKLRFSLFSYSTFVGVPFAAMKVLETIANLYSIAILNVNLRNFVDFVIDVMKICRVILMVRLAYMWPKLVRSANEIERVMKTEKTKVEKHCKIVYFIFNVLNLVNDVFFVLYYYQLSMVCSKKTDSPQFETLARYMAPIIFTFTPYSTWKGVVILISFCHNNYVKDIFDVFLMQISIYLNSYFDSFNKIIEDNEKVKGKLNAWVLKPPVVDLDWGEIRIHYNKISKLVRLLNGKISALIFITFGTDLILLWGQLLMIFRRGQFVDLSQCNVNEFRNVWTPYNYSRVVFLYSSTFALITRFFTTSFLAAKLHILSKKSAIILYEVSESTEFNIELERLITQIRTSTVALNGLGFFKITRSMMLTMAGTIATYELMVLQFAQDVRYHTNVLHDNGTYSNKTYS